MASQLRPDFAPSFSGRGRSPFWGSLSRSALTAVSKGAFALVTLMLAGSACGPSVQVLHEGTVRFEHCYRLDLDPQIAPSHRRACWQAWTERYSYGQPRDRREYAQRRIAAIDRGEPPPGLELTAIPEQASLDASDGPIDAHLPPPRIARPTNGLRQSDYRREGPGKGACVQSCQQDQASCLAACPTDGVCPCESRYRDCLVACFQ